MANDNINFYNYYFRYLWSATDFQNLEQAHKDSYRGSFDAMFNGTVLNGFGIQRQSSSICRILPGMALSKSGQLMIVSSNQSLTINTNRPVAPNTERALIVIRPLLTDNTPITNPNNPLGPTVNLRKKQGWEIALVRGVQSTNPQYPAPGPDDVVIAGTWLYPGNWGLGDIDLTVRDLPGRNRPNAGQGYRMYDDRLRPYRASNITIGIKPATLGMFNYATTKDVPTQFSWVANSGRPSMFPRSSFGDPNSTDTILNMNTGVISGGDQASSPWTPQLPNGSQYYLAGLVEIDKDDKLYVVYDPGGQQFNKDNASTSIWRTYDQLKPTTNRKMLAYFVLTSYNGTVWDDIDVFDTRYEGNVALNAIQAQVKTEMYNDQTWTAPSGVTKVRLSLHQRKVRQAMMYMASCVAIDTSGVAYAWGKNGAGQLGTGNVTTISSPVAVLGGKTWKQIVVGGPGSSQNTVNMIGIDSNDDAYAWGYNGGGNTLNGYQLGLGDATDRSSPIIIPGGRKWRTVASGLNGTGYGITTDGDLYAWGANANGEVGDGTVVRRSSPVLVLGGIKWRDVVPGINMVVALAVDGTPYSWGTSGLYQSLGNGLAACSSPVAVLGGYKFRNVAGGFRSGNYWYGITEAGKAYYWGEGGFGIGNFGGSSPTEAFSAGERNKTWRLIKPGYRSFLGITDEGLAYGAGENPYGQLGNNATGSVYTIQPVAGASRFVDIGLSFSAWENDFSESGYGLSADGQMMTWGYGGNGQLGNGVAPTSLTMRSSPVAISGPAGRFYNSIYDVFVTQVDVDVAPGNTYQLRLYPGFVSFGNVGIAVSKLFLKATLEYLTS